MAEVLRLRDYNKMKGLPYDPLVDGFVYSSSEIETEANRRNRRQQAQIAESVRFSYAEYKNQTEKLAA